CGRRQDLCEPSAARDDRGMRGIGKRVATKRSGDGEAIVPGPIVGPGADYRAADRRHRIRDHPRGESAGAVLAQLKRSAAASNNPVWDVVMHGPAGTAVRTGPAVDTPPYVGWGGCACG